jgi:hypothetical protein
MGVLVGSQQVDGQEGGSVGGAESEQESKCEASRLTLPASAGDQAAHDQKRTASVAGHAHAASQIGAAQQEAKLLLYERALHPAPLHIHSRRLLTAKLTGKTWECEVWILDGGGHATLFGCRDMPARSGYRCAQGGGWWCSELVAPSRNPVPTAGLLRGLAIPTEHDIDHRFGSSSVNYLCSMQCEQLSPGAFATELDEQLAFAKREHALAFPWTSVAGAGLSVVDLRRGERDIEVTAFHLLPLGGGYGASVRTQSLFEPAR